MANAWTWVFTILHKLLVNRLKQTARRGRHLTIGDASEAALARPASQEDRLRHRDLLREQQGLPEDQRKCSCSCQSKTYPMPRRHACPTCRPAQ
jgi:DNA-directed RNA polymerase specialized sigma24 family protein